MVMLVISFNVFSIRLIVLLNYLSGRDLLYSSYFMLFGISVLSAFSFGGIFGTRVVVFLGIGRQYSSAALFRFSTHYCCRILVYDEDVHLFRLLIHPLFLPFVSLSLVRPCNWHCRPVFEMCS